MNVIDAEKKPVGKILGENFLTEKFLVGKIPDGKVPIYRKKFVEKVLDGKSPVGKNSWREFSRRIFSGGRWNKNVGKISAGNFPG